MEMKTFDKRKTNMVKCIAIVFMLMHHLFGCSVKQWMQYGGRTRLIPMDWFVNLCMQMKVCVGMFIFLTAFGIARNYKNNRKEMSKSSIVYDSVRRYLNLEFDFLIIFFLALLTSFLRPGGIRSVYGGGWRVGACFYFADDACCKKAKMSSCTSL